jgi:hypothetical protein
MTGELRCPACGFPYGPGDLGIARDVYSCIACHTETRAGEAHHLNKQQPWRIPSPRISPPARVRISLALAARAVRILLKRP